MAPITPSAEETADCSAVRAALRKERLAARLALSPAAHAALSARIAFHLRHWLLGLAPRTIAFCAPIRGEFDATALVTELVCQGWQAAMPVVETPAAAMVFRNWTPGVAMNVDPHGIPVPALRIPATPDLVLLPLLAFDPHGYRLGYGGGYFDRTIVAMVPRPVTAGVGFELGRIASILPQPHDVALDAIVTEAGVFHHRRAQDVA